MKTKVWRSYNEVPGAGHFIWSVSECDSMTQEDADRYPGMYLPTLDGGFILDPICDFFWTEVKANNYYYTNDFPQFVEVVLIGDGPVPF